MPVLSTIVVWIELNTLTNQRKSLRLFSGLPLASGPLDRLRQDVAHRCSREGHMDHVRILRIQ